MVCSECNGNSKVIDNVEIDGYMYRKRQCLNCGHKFYTTEIEVNYKRIRNEWNANYRRAKASNTN